MARLSSHFNIWLSYCDIVSAVIVIVFRTVHANNAGVLSCWLAVLEFHFFFLFYLNFAVFMHSFIHCMTFEYETYRLLMIEIIFFTIIWKLNSSFHFQIKSSNGIRIEWLILLHIDFFYSVKTNILNIHMRHT